jgi:Uma2 family endonuclease
LFQIVDGTLNHNSVVSKIIRRTMEALDGSSCCVFGAARVKASTRYFVFPDVTIFCGPVETAPENLVTPKVIVGVLSPSPTDYDRERKFELYQELRSLRE